MGQSATGQHKDLLYCMVACFCDTKKERLAKLYKVLPKEDEQESNTWLFKTKKIYKDALVGLDSYKDALVGLDSYKDALVGLDSYKLVPGFYSKFNVKQNVSRTDDAWVCEVFLRLRRVTDRPCCEEDINLMKILRRDIKTLWTYKEWSRFV